MSKYTTELRYICEDYTRVVESQGYNHIAEIIEASRTKIFDQPYPIFDESYRGVLETKIIKHFYTREIGVESVGLWKHFVDMKMNEIMPYYNQKYRSTLLKFNPFYDVDLKTEADTNGSGSKNDSSSQLESKNDVRDLTRTDDNTINKNTTENTNTNNSGESSNNSTAETDSSSNGNDLKYNAYSETPQGTLNNVYNNSYLTNATKDSETKETTDHSEVKSNTNGAYNDNGNVEKIAVNSETDERVVSDHENTNSSRNRTDALTSNFTNTEQYIQHVYGKRGGVSYSKLLDEFRKTFLNIDMEIINEFNELFMQIY